MRRSISFPVSMTFAALATLMSVSLADAADDDVPGSRDYPGIGRFAGSTITGYDAKDFDATRLQTAAFQDGKATGEERPEGRVTRIAYRTGPGPSIVEVARNFETQITGAGYETVFVCDTDGCGGIPFSEALDILPIPEMWVDGFNYHYFVGRKTGENGAVTWATVLVSQNNDAITAELVVTEVGAMANKMIDAAAMAKGLGDKGHIALYGIYFDTDKAVVKPESKPTLEEIARLLTGAPDLEVVIVGHTDSQGTPDYNMDLSHRRAAAVAAVLAKSYGIPAARLTTAGVGFLAPVGSNQTEDGRALNRRVELVEP
jgi:outer membrane protein OmpA-like peptidoglycan-associated protein